MKRETREQLDRISTGQLSFYQRADAVVRLFADDDVSEIVTALAADFRDELVAFGRQAYAPEGERMVVAGDPIPVACLRAFRVWLRAHDVAMRRAQSDTIERVASQLSASSLSSPPSEFVPHAPENLGLVERVARRGGGLPRQVAP